MSTPPTGEAGAPAGPSTAAAPFAVTAPPELALGADRTGSTSFTVTNLTGRPVRARLLPRGRDGAEDAWLAVAGTAEVPMPVAGTVSVEVTVRVPPAAPEGRHTLFLEVVAEDDTERVSGQSVSFTVGPPPPPRRRFPWLVVLVAALVLLLGAGVAVYLLTRSTPGPANVAPPQVAGEPVVGRTLTAQEGTWTGKDLTFGYQWAQCQGDGSLCQAVEGGTGRTLDLTSALAGQQIRVHVTASNADGTDTEQSANVGPVQVVVPQLRGMLVNQATAVAKQAGLNLTARVVLGGCSRVTGQSPGAGEVVPFRSTVTVTVITIIGRC